MPIKLALGIGWTLGWVTLAQAQDAPSIPHPIDGYLVRQARREAAGRRRVLHLHVLPQAEMTPFSLRRRRPQGHCPWRA
jgi:hypothetical protein